MATRDADDRAQRNHPSWHAPPTPSPGRGPYPLGRDSGLANLPMHEFTQIQIHFAIVAPACEVTPWMQLLALSGHQARRWSQTTQAAPVHHRRTAGHHGPTPHLSTHAPGTQLALQALSTLRDPNRLHETPRPVRTIFDQRDAIEVAANSTGCPHCNVTVAVSR